MSEVPVEVGESSGDQIDRDGVQLNRVDVLGPVIERCQHFMAPGSTDHCFMLW